MPKERVVVFDGEDKFIAPRNVTYDKAVGEANAVGDGSAQKVEEPQGKLTPEGTAFEQYMRDQNRPVVMPSVGEDNFCQKMQTFIQTRGMGKATPDQIQQAYQLFQDNCRPKEGEQPKEEPATKERVPTEPAPPTPPQKDVPVEKPKPAVSSGGFVPLTSPTLGRPLGGGAGGGDSEEAVPEQKKVSNLLLWLILGGTILYFVTRKKG
jgi:hypothetical protein